MKNRIASLGALLIVLAAGFAYAQAAPAPTEASAAKTGCTDCQCSAEKNGATPAKAEIGQPAPAFSLLDAEGRTHNLADYRGKVVAIVWTNPGCPYIVRHYKEGTFGALKERYQDQDVAVLLIDTSEREQAAAVAATRKAAETYQHKLVVLHDVEGTVGRAYNAQRTPQAYVIDKEGRLVFNGAFDDDPQGRKPAAEREVYAIQAIEAALAGQTPAMQTTPPRAIYGCAVKYPAGQS